VKAAHRDPPVDRPAPAFATSGCVLESQPEEAAMRPPRPRPTKARGGGARRASARREVAAERGVGGPGQHLHITAEEHGRQVCRLPEGARTPPDRSGYLIEIASPEKPARSSARRALRGRARNGPDWSRKTLRPRAIGDHTCLMSDRAPSDPSPRAKRRDISYARHTARHLYIRSASARGAADDTSGGTCG